MDLAKLREHVLKLRRTIAIAAKIDEMAKPDGEALSQFWTATQDGTAESLVAAARKWPAVDAAVVDWYTWRMASRALVDDGTKLVKSLDKLAAKLVAAEAKQPATKEK